MHRSSSKRLRKHKHITALGVNWDVNVEELKAVYYQLARRYHPIASVRSIRRSGHSSKQFCAHYASLRYASRRQSSAGYNSKLEARRKAQQTADAAVTQPAPQEASRPEDAGVSKAERAAAQFKEGLAALELGEKNSTGIVCIRCQRGSKRSAISGDVWSITRRRTNGRRSRNGIARGYQADSNNANYRVTLAELYRDLD